CAERERLVLGRSRGHRCTGLALSFPALEETLRSKRCGAGSFGLRPEVADKRVNLGDRARIGCFGEINCSLQGCRIPRPGGFGDDANDWVGNGIGEDSTGKKCCAHCKKRPGHACHDGPPGFDCWRTVILRGSRYGQETPSSAGSLFHKQKG